MNRIFMRLTLAAASLVLAATFAFAGPLDDYYLQQYGEPTARALQKAVLLQQQETDDVPHCGTPLKHGLQRDWNQLEPATQKVLAKQLGAPALASEATFDSSLGRFRIHYATTGSDAPPLTDANGNGIPDWVETVAQTFENVATAYSGLGWHLAPTAAGAPYDVYLHDLAPQRLYGQTTTSGQLLGSPFANSVASFIEIDNDYLDAVFQNALGGSLSADQKALQSLQITAAHEYHHAIQYGYNFYFDVWYAEATSTWNEDELYDNVNQLYSYLHKALANTNLSLDIPPDVTTGGGYGRWLFNRHLTESLGNSFVRTAWEKLAILNSPGGNADISMTPVLDALLLPAASSVGNELLLYAGKLYTGAWTTHVAEIPLIPAVSMSGEYASNLVNVATVPSPSITLPHYSCAYYRLTPPDSPSTTLTISLTRDPGISAVAFRKVNATFTSFSSSTGSNRIVVPGFNHTNEVVILLVNSTATDNLFAGFSTDGSTIRYALSGTTISTASAVTSPASITISWTAVSGAASYQIYRSSISSTSLTAYATTSSTSFTDTSVVADHTYYYSVVPTNSAVQAGPASQVKAVNIPASTPAAASGGGGGGCFIATAAYGSYLAPQVQVLRNFRDTRLLTNAPGRAFVALYYRLSPPVADVIARHEFLRLLVRMLLTPLVALAAHAGATGFLLAGVIAVLPLKKAARSIGRRVSAFGGSASRLG
jgi:hypothetical protein